MPTTPKTLIPYPHENQDPFYDVFVGMVEAIDFSLYSQREDRHAVLMDGGLVTFTVNSGSGLGVLTWAADISIAAPIMGFRWMIPAGSLSLQDGEVVYVTLTRGATDNLSVTAQKAFQVPSGDSDFLVAIRKGAVLYFRNGRSIRDGDALNVLEASTGTGGSGIGGGSGEFKSPCRVATTANMAFAGTAPNVVDGITLLAGDRVLVWQQTSAVENGIYQVDVLGTGANGTWSRAVDANTNALVKAGLVIAVTEGTSSDTLFELVTNNPIVLGITPLLFAVLGADLASAVAQAVVPGGTGSAGVATKAAREDHRHALAASATVSKADAGTATVGTTSTVALGDHKHRLEVRVQRAGVTVGDRPVVNFVSGVTIADNPGSDRVDIVVPQIGLTGQTFRSVVPIALAQNTSQTVFQVVGMCGLNPADYTVAGTTASFRLKTCGFVTGTANAEFQLYDLTSAAIVATQTSASTTPSDVSTAVTLPTGMHIYEIRIRVSSGTGSVFAQWAGIEILNTI